MIVKSKTQQSLGWAGLMSVVVCLLCLTTWSPALAQSDPDLPPRHLTPTRQPSEGDENDDKPVGAHIELRASAAPRGAWSVVQWQDELGDWHDVEGWQGELDTMDQKVWWVAQHDWGRGPFRWTLYSKPGGSLLGTSKPFRLPIAAYEIVTVEVSLNSKKGLTNGQPTPPATPLSRPLLPTTGKPPEPGRLPVSVWPTIILLLVLIAGGGLLPKRNSNGG